MSYKDLMLPARYRHMRRGEMPTHYFHARTGSVHPVDGMPEELRGDAVYPVVARDGAAPDLAAEALERALIRANAAASANIARDEQGRLVLTMDDSVAFRLDGAVK